MKYNPYSVSRMGTFSTCPKKFKLQYIDKIKIESEPKLALYRGGFAHEILEHNFNYNIVPKLNEVFTQEEANKVIEMIKEFRNTPLGKSTEKMINHPSSVREEDFAFNTKLKLVDFWDKDSWIRGSADLYNVDTNQPLLVDYKTGKDKSNDLDFGYEQGMVYAIYMFIKFPNLTSINAIFIFIEHSTKKTIVYNRSDFTEYIRKLYNKTKKIEENKVFKENISSLCLFCDYNNTEFCSSYKENEEKTKHIMKSKISLDF